MNPRGHEPRPVLVSRWVKSEAQPLLADETRQAYRLGLRNDNLDIMTPSRVSWALSTHKYMVRKLTKDRYEKDV